MQFVITGDSDKLTKFLYVVEADSLEAAFQKVADIDGDQYVLDEEWGHLLLPGSVSKEDAKESMDTGNGPRRFWVMAGAQVELNVNLEDAVIW